VLALSPARRHFQGRRKPLVPPPIWLLAICGAIAAAIWYGLVLLAFGLRPTFPPAIAMAAGIALAAIIIYLLPRYAEHPWWGDAHRMGVALGTVMGSMIVSFAGFIYGAAPLDLYGKIVLDVIATLLLAWLAASLRRPANGLSSSPPPPVAQPG
jgi:hypothetical protein